MKNPMNNTMQLLMTTLFAGALLVAASSAIAGDNGDRGKQGKHLKRGPPGSMIVDQFARELRQLDLNDEQKADVKNIMQDLRAQSKSIGKDLKANQMLLRDVIKADNWDEDAAAELAANEGDLTAQRTLLTSKALAGIYAQLNDEQRAELEANAEERMERRAERTEGRGERKFKTE